MDNWSIFFCFSSFSKQMFCVKKKRWGFCHKFCVTNLPKATKLHQKKFVTNNDNVWLFSLVIVRNAQKVHYINHTWQKTGYPLSNAGCEYLEICIKSLFLNLIQKMNVHWTLGLSMWQIIQEIYYYNEVVGTVKSMTVWWHLHKLRWWCAVVVTYSYYIHSEENCHSICTKVQCKIDEIMRESLNFF